jgi:hypothetical protein
MNKSEKRSKRHRRKRSANSSKQQIEGAKNFIEIFNNFPTQVKKRKKAEELRKQQETTTRQRY